MRERVRRHIEALAFHVPRLVDENRIDEATNLAVALHRELDQAGLVDEARRVADALDDEGQPWFERKLRRTAEYVGRYVRMDHHV